MSAVGTSAGRPIGSPRTFSIGDLAGAALPDWRSRQPACFGHPLDAFDLGPQPKKERGDDRRNGHCRSTLSAGVDAMREYKGSEIRNIAVVGHGASGKTSLVDALAFVSGSSQATRLREGRHGAHRLRRRRRSSADTPSTSAARTPSGRTRRSTCIDTPGYLDFQGDAIAGLAAADGALVRGPGHVGRRSRHGADVPRSGRPPRSGALRRLDDGQGARRLRPHLPADQDAAHEQGHSRRSAGRAGRRLSRRRQPLHEARAPVQARREDGRLRGNRHSRRGAGSSSIATTTS